MYQDSIFKYPCSAGVVPYIIFGLGVITLSIGLIGDEIKSLERFEEAGHSMSVAGVSLILISSMSRTITYLSPECRQNTGWLWLWTLVSVVLSGVLMGFMVWAKQVEDKLKSENKSGSGTFEGSLVIINWWVFGISLILILAMLTVTWGKTSPTTSVEMAAGLLMLSLTITVIMSLVIMFHKF